MDGRRAQMEIMRARFPAVGRYEGRHEGRHGSQKGVLLAALLGLSLLAALGPVDTAQAQSLFGRVTADDGAALVGATIALPSIGRGTVTDRDGRYRIAGLPADTVTVAISFVGFERWRARHVQRVFQQQAGGRIHRGSG